MPRHLLVAPLFLLSGACLMFKHPLCDPATTKPDEALLGVWEMADDKGRPASRVTVSVVDRGEAARPRKVMRAVEVRLDEGGKETKTDRFVFFTCELAGHKFAHLHDEKAPMGYEVLRYRVDGKKLTIWIAQTKSASDDLKKHKLATSFHGGTFGRTRVDATTAELRKALTKEMAERWWSEGEWATYTRAGRGR
jgi:hypothetical protein